MKKKERITKIKSFINQYNWEEISFPSHKNDWKKVELNNKTIALNILYVPFNTKEMHVRHAYKSKHKLNAQKLSNFLNYYW